VFILILNEAKVLCFKSLNSRSGSLRRVATASVAILLQNDKSNLSQFVSKLQMAVFTRNWMVIQGTWLWCHYHL